jgi:hypothetical protein
VYLKGDGGKDISMERNPLDGFAPHLDVIKVDEDKRMIPV